MSINSLSKLIVITALLLVLLGVFLLHRRKIFDLRQVGITLLAAIAGTIGFLIGAYLYLSQWEFFIGKLVSDHTPSDVISDYNLTAYYETALAGILMAVLFCLALYLLQRFIPAELSKDTHG